MTRQKNPDAQWAQMQAEFLATMRDWGPFDLSAGTLVVVPSLTLPNDELKDLVGVQYYEERLLFLLLLLRRPGVRIIFITSSEVASEIIDYYLGFLPDHRSARDRLDLVAVHDTRRLPLTTKILAHPEAVSRIRDLARTHRDTYLLPFNVTEQEEELASRVGIPIYGMPSRVAYLGQKSHGRVVARAAGVPVVDGAEDIHTPEDVQHAFTRLCRRGADRAVLKLNDSFSGMGNVILSHQSTGEGVSISSTFRVLLPKGVSSWDDYLNRLLLRGGAMELMIPGPLTSPSVQMLIKPGGGLELVSTHNQILGGIANQIYLGCEFPATATYRRTIVTYARKIAAVLAEHGVVGLLAIDFLVSPSQDQVYFGEINLRLGGTTHPFGICQYLTWSQYQEETGLLMSPQGARYYVASDNVQNDLLIGRSPAAVLKAMSEARMVFDQSNLSGVILHQMGSLPESGKLGICSVAASPEEARAAFHSAISELTQA